MGISQKRSQRRRVVLWLCAAVIIALLVVVGPPVVFLATVWLRDGNEVYHPEAGKTDFGKFDKNTPGEIIPVSSDPQEAERQLCDLVKRAGREHLKISISGAKHSMGGHTLYPGGIALDMLPFNKMELDEKRGILTVGAGARWFEVIPYLDQRGFAVAVMQSSNDFSVGGSLSVNCHGWEPDSPPIVSSVESFRLVAPDGRILRCSRNENAELFSLVPGGYGLFGIILDVELRVVPNDLYKTVSHKVKPVAFAADYDSAVRDPDVGMAYGRISVAPASFLNEAYIVLEKKQSGVPARGTLQPEGEHFLERLIFRGSVGSDYGKNLCWRIQAFTGGEESGSQTRNEIMNQSSKPLADREGKSVEILQEYFVPHDQLAAFVETMRPILLKHKPDLLNITVRNIKADPDTVLAYARQDVFALVMLYHESTDPQTDAAMEKFTREMIDAVLQCGGTYYLPYRPHATQQQFEKAYPRSAEFFAAKRKYDPDGIFENLFYTHYGQPDPAKNP